jgi:O-antigen/teichoic acid export membrane protein
VSPISTGPAGVDARRAARSTAFALAATAIDKGGGLVLLLAIARLLGTDGFGRYAALMSLLALFQVAAELGQEPVLVRFLAQDRRRATGALVEGALAMRIVLALGAGVLLVLLGPLVLPAVGRGPLALAAAGLVASSGIALRALFRTLQRLEWLCVTALARVAAFGAALAGAHALGLGLLGAVAAWATGQLAASLAAATLAAGRVSPRPRWRTAVAAGLARSGWALAANAFLLTVTLRVGHLIVLHHDGPTAVGHLAAGAQLAEAFALIPEAVMLALLPVLSAFDLDARDSQRAVSAWAVRVLALMALPAVIALSIAAPTVLGLLYGPAYVAGAPALQILAWLGLLAASGTVFTNLLIARGYERLLLGLNLLGSALTLGLSLVAVPRAGFVGAAAATLVASVVSQAVLLVLPETRREVAACLRPLVWPVALAAGLALGGMAAAGPRPLVAGAALAAFAVLLAATRAVGPEDWAVVRRALGRA